MSLASTAAQWINDNQPKKRQPSIRKTVKARPYEDETTDEPDEYSTQAEAFQIMQNLKNSTPATLDDIQAANTEKSQRVNDILNKITAFNADNDGNKLADFVPIDKPIITNNRAPIKDANGYDPTLPQPVKYPLDPAELLPATLEKQRAGPYSAVEPRDVPYSNYNQTYNMPRLFQSPPQTSANPNSVPFASSDRLMEKINYMIHLLEEQKSERTANITEEFILYIFLGVFVIYTVDSFTKVGKYIR